MKVETEAEHGLRLRMAMRREADRYFPGEGDAVGDRWYNRMLDSQQKDMEAVGPILKALSGGER